MDMPVHLQSHFGEALYPASLITHGEAPLALIRTDRGRRLAVAAKPDDPARHARYAELHREFQALYARHFGSSLTTADEPRETGRGG